MLLQNGYIQIEHFHYLLYQQISDQISDKELEKLLKLKTAAAIFFFTNQAKCFVKFEEIPRRERGRI